MRRTLVLLLAACLAACGDEPRKKPEIRYDDPVDAGTVDAAGDASRDGSWVDVGTPPLDGGSTPDSGKRPLDMGSASDTGPSPIDMGTQPADTGTNPLDVGPTPVDLGPAPVDLGPTPVDLGPTPVDMGPTPVDMGPTPVDMGPTPVDMGTTPVDMGTTPVDMGTTPVDMGTPPADMGSTNYGMTCPIPPPATFPGQCDPVALTGCSSTQDCVIALQVQGADVVISSACTSDSRYTLQEGDVCVGRTARCAPGLFCISYLGVCKRLCWNDDAEGCYSNEYCTQPSEDWNQIGYCASMCE